ncbi:MAG TPA: PDZ domain-containing protein [Pyrinomonadaceae bacterium]|nr:PDZ domain-containing protein [Pyrinomonadaceae bacterium]
MPSELRFCRNCGFRLTSEFGGYTVTDASGPIVPSAPPKKKRRFSGMSWIFIGLLAFFVVAAAFTALVSPLRNSPIINRTPVVRAVIGARYNQTDEGVSLESSGIPNGPADKAGLIGGDLLVSVDGQKVQNEDQLDDLMTKTPIGKTIDIEYLRDGEKKTAKLTTISADDEKRLNREFDRRPEGRASFGYEPGDAERTQVPGSTVYGVKLGTVLRSRPADLAGVKANDIIIEFDGVAIRTTDELLMRVRRAVPYSTVKLVVMRGPAESEEPQADEGEAPKETNQVAENKKFEKVEIPVKLGKQ